MSVLTTLRSVLGLNPEPDLFATFSEAANRVRRKSKTVVRVERDELQELARGMQGKPKPRARTKS